MRLVKGRAWVEIDPVGAIIADAGFHVGGQTVRPLFQNPWRDDPREMDVLTRHLGGEWPCVPFGVPDPPGDLPLGWPNDLDRAPWHKHAHGFGAHRPWTLTQDGAQTVLAEITYPEDGPVVGLKRRVHLASESEIQLELEVSARQDAALPIGLHPVVSLADAAPGAAFLRVAGEDSAWTFPRDVEPGRSRLQANQQGVSLRSLLSTDGTSIDAAALPFAGHSEDLILLTAPGGCVSLSRPDLGYQVDVTWDDTHLPSCLLWLSNRGRDYAPWDGRVCAVGIEPVAAAFDLGVEQSRSLNTPLARAGVRTTAQLKAGEVWRTDYSIAVQTSV
ncbi:aldose epimerase family protein [Pseudooctadecabacter jejudonensis]|uniref:Aldose 1-epimerase n=1 Tax=Pseudooctadecabacter jejudonensis TaxID=1391910 RepID=A0A1Y5TID2_9RHOB|nr:hypothetical protein [Pseudooctadecabacter jejudonensis]SLN62719.1 hypothetical protein PSJ8397_03331 [Pseudooctadecabacter jejudonensis]